MYFCSLKSAENQEDLIGTGLVYKNFLFIECDEPWEENALASSSIPSKIKTKLIEFNSKAENRLLLIKKGNSNLKADKSLTLISAKLTGTFFHVKEMHINSYQDLIKLDLYDLPIDSKIIKHYIFICTNGKKDKCCSKFGYSSFKNFESNNCEDKVDIWQCSHLGGDRFAATCLVLPQGAYYGRIQDCNPKSFIDNLLDEKLILENLRGRSIYDGYIQAAEYFIRKKNNITKLDALTFSGATNLTETSMLVRFNNGTVLEEIAIEKYKVDYKMAMTCNAQEMQSPYKYRVLNNLI
ncbi:sucrase ferredoxin [Nubsella zeaxanthinifaciens]|uniref:sucrase ferredoxin n=1 Tax=Nubsella zeaxanthinifaciens TaxID=392412 RepID=UPI003D069211